jgi:hypothetical protein
VAQKNGPPDLPFLPRPAWGAAATREVLLERGEVLFYPSAPFALPREADHTFLLEQQLSSLGHKNISYDPATGKASGFVRQSAEQAERLRGLLAGFSRAVTDWVRKELRRFAGGLELDRVSYRPLEEATRRLRQTARNDLLHVDAFPNRPTNGQRILRVFANVNPSEPRVWVTSDPFGKLLERYGVAAGLPGRHAMGLLDHVRQGLFSIFHPGRRRRSAYDAFMLRFHDYLKNNEEFQERGPKRLWNFPPASVWLAITDTCSHAVLRGRFALEQSYFVAPAVLALPEESPPALLRRFCEATRSSRAA